MTSSLAGTVAHGARGGRGVSTSHFCRIFPGLSGTPRYSPELPGSGSHNSNKCGKGQELIQSSTISDQGYHMGK